MTLYLCNVYKCVLENSVEFQNYWIQGSASHFKPYIYYFLCVLTITY